MVVVVVAPVVGEHSNKHLTAISDINKALKLTKLTVYPPPGHGTCRTTSATLSITELPETNHDASEILRTEPPFDSKIQ